MCYWGRWWLVRSLGRVGEGFVKYSWRGRGHLVRSLGRIGVKWHIMFRWNVPTAILSQKKIALGVYKTRGGEYIYNRIRVGEGAKAIRFPCRGKWNCLLWRGRFLSVAGTWSWFDRDVYLLWRGWLLAEGSGVACCGRGVSLLWRGCFLAMGGFSSCCGVVVRLLWRGHSVAEK